MPLAADPPNIILIIADDQRWDSLAGRTPGASLAGVMPELERHLVRPGTLFTQAVVASPLCCPARSSLLSGGYASHHTSVLTNHWPEGGARKFPDDATIGTRLQQRGYLTGYVGKYMNEYGRILRRDSNGTLILTGRYIPPGWHAFSSYTVDAPRWRRYPFSLGTSGPGGPTGGIKLPDEAALLPGALPVLVSDGLPQPVADTIAALDLDDLPHITDFERQFALSFLEDAFAQPQRPFFLLLSTAVPHDPASPATQDRDLFAGYTYRGRGWGEADTGDKPAHIQERGKDFEDHYNGGLTSHSNDRSPDEYFADQLRSLQGVDRAVGEVVRAVEAAGLLGNTVIIYTADHGLQWGEHRVLCRKKLPYEESIRVPLVIRHPQAASGVSHRLVTADLDVGTTILHLAGYTQAELAGLRTDGRSLVPLLLDPGHVVRDDVLIQDYRAAELGSDPSWAGIRTRHWKYVGYDTLDEELYSLAGDRHEMESRHASPRNRDQRTLGDLSARLAARRGLVILSSGWDRSRLADGTVGAAYSFQLTAAGGAPPHTFSDQTGVFSPPTGTCRAGLPPGLALDASGHIHGSPTQAGCFEVHVAVHDSSLSPVHGGPQANMRRARIRVNDMP